LINACFGGCTDRRIDAHIARTQFGQIMDIATRNNERFVVDRRGEPAVLIMSVQDFIRTVAPPPDWLEKPGPAPGAAASRRLRPDDIEAEIAAQRRSHKDGSATLGGVIRAVIDTSVLVSGLLMPSGNEAPVILAIHHGFLLPCWLGANKREKRCSL